MTNRQDYICIISRKMYAEGFGKEDVHAVCDDVFRTLNSEAREYYQTLAQGQLKALDRDIWRRVRDLRGEL